MDTTPLGLFVTKVMEQVGESFDDDAEIRTVGVLVEVDTGDATHIMATCDDDRPWVQIEFLHQAIYSLESRFGMVSESDD
jgi:hypothetical protein